MSRKHDKEKRREEAYYYDNPDYIEAAVGQKTPQTVVDEPNVLFKKKEKKNSHQIAIITIVFCFIFITVVVVTLYFILVYGKSSSVSQDDIDLPFSTTEKSLMSTGLPFSFLEGAEIITIQTRITIAEINGQAIEFTNELNDQESIEYQSLENNLIDEMDRIYKNSTYADIYNRTEVLGFSQGSVIGEVQTYMNSYRVANSSFESRDLITTNEIENMVEVLHTLTEESEVLTIMSISVTSIIAPESSRVFTTTASLPATTKTIRSTFPPLSTAHNAELSSMLTTKDLPVLISTLAPTTNRSTFPPLSTAHNAESSSVLTTKDLPVIISTLAPTTSQLPSISHQTTLELTTSQLSFTTHQTTDSAFKWPDSCGEQASEPRIIGGDTAEIGNWPWQGALFNDDQYICGATLLTEQWILTAAHCIIPEGSLKVVIGDTSLNGTSAYRVSRDVIAYVHPNYDASTYNNDFALLKTKEKIELNAYVSPACILQSQEVIQPGDECWITGWGSIDPIYPVFPTQLQEAKTLLVNQEDCQELLAKEGLPSITEKMICAGNKSGVDTCFGDSGGPLVCESGGSFYLVGVTSWGYACAQANIPSVYAYVPSALDWISSILTDPCTNIGTEENSSSNCICPDNYFVCTDIFCSPETWKCNGIPQCQNSTDEFNCTTTECTNNEVECKNGQCITMVSWCDGKTDCIDGSDEDQCNTCPEFSCSDGVCLESDLVCDGYENCINKTDEMMCPPPPDHVTCSSEQYTCSDGTCIAKEWICDGIMADCFGNEDELECPGEIPLGICGLQPGVSKEARIISGDDADAGEWPWQAALYHNGGFICGATLLNRRWLFCAAHCILHNSGYHVIMGDIHLTKNENSTHRKIISVEPFPHPLFNPLTFSEDYSLLKLVHPVEFNDYIQPACLPINISFGFPPQTPCWTTGWGSINTTALVVSEILQEALVSLILSEECDGMIPQAQVSSNMICAGHEEGVPSGCFGDSGGPLVCEESGMYYLIGATSWRYGLCGTPGSPVVYSKVTEALDWINRTLHGEDSCAEFGGFVCKNQEKCIQEYLYCDGNFDCIDGSDENNCTCTQDEFQCVGGWCVSGSWECDGFNDCGDNSDEENCSNDCILATEVLPDCRGYTLVHPDNTSYVESVLVQSFMDLILSNLNNCSQYLDIFFCPLVLQTCDQGTLPSLPCQSLCNSVQKDCQKMFVSAFGDNWPYVCDTLPEETNCISCPDSKCKDCSEDQFTCPVDNSCIPASWKCDGSFGDCEGNDDEENCEVFGNLTCGVQPALESTKSRIVGGENAEFGAWPWQISLSHVGKHFCGGTLISRTWVLTAAHCTAGLSAGDIRVLVGDNELDGASPERREVTVKEIYDHPNYNTSTNNYDYSMLRLSDAVEYSDYRLPACLQEIEFLEGTKCWATGWGYLEADDTVTPPFLQQVDLDLYSSDDCAKALSIEITEQMICAGYPEGKKDTCQGDSGGPLVCQENGDGPFFLAGVTSFGFGCADPDSPGVYAKVSAELNWIYAVLNNSFDCNFICTGDGSCIPEFRVCDGRQDCSDFSDEIGCCTSEQFACPEGCIPLDYVCDNYIDCLDNYDEQNCTIGCEEFTCLNGECIYSNYFCDGYSDCNDASDELYCSTSQPIECLDDQIMCPTGECIYSSWLCDGIFDCGDFFDEQHCSPNQPDCEEDQFPCPNGNCLSSISVCNGINDCLDNSDEQNCTEGCIEYECSDGSCIYDAWVCDDVFGDCILNEDEKNCEQINTDKLCECGRTTSATKSGRIVGGQNAKIGEVPYQVAIFKDDVFFCGGSLLSRKWILTAAHCMEQYSDASGLTIMVGDIGLESGSSTQKFLPVEQFYVHPNYDSILLDNDFALLRTNLSIECNDNVIPTCLPDNATIVENGMNCLISGWGSLQENGAFPEVLQVATVELILIDVCSPLFSTGEITDNMICAGFLQDGGVDACEGDSGGPLVCEIDGRYQLFGITSWGYGCGEEYQPGVYAKVSSALAWIDAIINGNPYSS